MPISHDPSPPNFIGEIETDLLDNNVPLSAVLRKTQVLSYRLENGELNTWVQQEQRGYGDKSDEEIPDYRVHRIGTLGTFLSGTPKMENAPRPTVSAPILLIPITR